MGFQARLYKNTGFNTSNIPDSPGLLDSCQHIDASSSIEYMQDRFLTTIPIQVASYDVIKDVDYLRVNDFYYFVTGISMSSIDVANFLLTPDFITSARGITGFTILDGVTNRVHVSDDVFGKADSSDPLLTPFEPLEVETEWHKPTSGGCTYTESTINITATAGPNDPRAYKATRWTDGNSVTATAVVLTPQTKGVGPSHTTVFFQNNGVSEQHATIVNRVCQDSGMSTPQETINTSIGALRSLGLEQSIVNQVRIPNAYLNTSGALTDNTVHEMRSKTGLWNVSNFPYNAFANVKNMLINYSSYMKYGLISCAGESCEFEPQDLHTSDDQTTYPQIKYVTDPHLDGKPYFRFKKVNGDESNDGFWRNCISGMQWKQVPLVFQGASGSLLNQLRFENARTLTSGARTLEVEKMGNDLERSMGGTGFTNKINASSANSKAAGFGGLVDLAATSVGVAAKMLSNPFDIVQNLFGNVSSAYDSARISDYQYGAELKNQLLDIAIKNNVYVPTVNFPYNSHVLQESFENGVLVYRYKYRTADVNRIDKLLTMYGYKFSKALETSDFTNRRYFNFVECSNVTVTGKPRWWNDGIAAQLKGGVRVWHVLPNPTYYNDNPVA